MLSSLTPGQFRVIIGLLAVLAVVLVALIAVQLTGDDEPVTAGATTTIATTVPATTEPSTTTSEATTTTVSQTTTTSSEATTTTVSQTTTTSEATTTTVPQTTTIPPVGVVLSSDGLGVVFFGATPEDTISSLTGALGTDPDVDTGWIDAFENPYGTCPPPEVRGVEWGMLVALFTKAGTDFASEGTEHFFSYNYAPQPSKPGAGPHGLETAEGVGLGSSRTELLAAYGDRVQIFDDEIFGSFFQIDLDFDTDTALGGNMTGPEDTDRVSSFLGGEGCGE